MATPRLGAPELTAAQASKETTVNEQVRYMEQGSGHFIIEDRNLSAPAGTETDGQGFIVSGTGTGAWAGHDGDIAFKLNTGWKFIDIQEGFTFWIKDENKFLVATSASTFSEFAAVSGEWVPNFTAAGDVYIAADTAMTISQGNAAIGIGTLAYEKSTNAAPGTFSSTTLPATLEAGAWLKVTASAVTGFVATHLKRTA